MKVAIIGATGLVGQVMLKVLEEHNFPVEKLLPVASTKSVGKNVRFKGQDWEVLSIEEAIQERPTFALFSAGASTSLEWAPRFAEVGSRVIDNSSAWRMDPSVKLVVPEVNGHVLTEQDRIIANPNCSTIQMVMALFPIHQVFGIERIIVSTYQSFTGTGMKAVKQYELEKNGFEPDEAERAYPWPIFENCLPHCDIFLENDYTKEEMKLVHETRKILGEPDLRITATAVRVPVHGGHSESVNVELKKIFDMSSIRRALHEMQGVELMDDPAGFRYPMPLEAKNRDEVWVGRVRRDESVSNGLNLWIVADNLRKGAATNTVQIATYMLEKELLPKVDLTA